MKTIHLRTRSIYISVGMYFLVICNLTYFTKVQIDNFVATGLQLQQEELQNGIHKQHQKNISDNNNSDQDTDDGGLEPVIKSKKEVLDAIPLDKWCLKYQKTNNSFAPYMDKHKIKRILPTLAPGLGFAREYAVVNHGREITEKLLKTLPNTYFMKGTAISGGVIKVIGQEVKCLKGPCVQRLPRDTLASYLRRLCDRISAVNYWVRGETAYKLIPKRCIFEEEFPMGSDFRDYKAWVFNGRVMFVHIDSGRFTGQHHKNLRTPEWKEITGMRIVGHGNGHGTVELPEQPPPFYKQLVSHANQIGKLFKYARIDFFVFNNTHKFSEITACHMGCKFDMEPKIVQHFFGYMLTKNLSVDPEFLLKLTNSV